MQNKYEQEVQGQKVPAYPPEQSYGKRLWHLWGPLVIKWGISVAVSFAVILVYMFFYMSVNYNEVAGVINNDEAAMNLAMSISEEVLKYSTQIEGIAALITIPLLLFFFFKDRKIEKMYGIIPNKKAALWKYGAIVIISAAMCVGLNNLIIISNLSAISASYEGTSEALYSAPIKMQILCLVILIPICEELVFRGLMFKRIRERAGFVQSAVYSALVFGIFHGNLVQMLYGFVLGMLLAYMYEKYGSVKAPIIGHVIMNLVSVLATYYKVYEWMVEDFIRIGGITVGCAAISATMFVLIQRIDEKPESTEQEKENLAAM